MKKYSFKTGFKIGPFEIGPGRPSLLVAEIGGNHGGDPVLARRMIDAAHRAGVHLVKFQAYQTKTFLTRQSGYYDELAREELGFKQLENLAAYCRSKNLLFLVSVFDRAGIDLVRRLECPAVKISSGDLDNHPLLDEAAGLGLPLILSTGASDFKEIEQALDRLEEKGARKVLLLQCTSLYPCPDDQVNLRVIPELARLFNLPVGFSDHSPGVEIPLAAMALGAALVEKHFTTDRDLPAGDNEMSCLPEEMALLVKAAPRLTRALGSPDKKLTVGEVEVPGIIRRSIVAGHKISPGETLTLENLALKRPGGGIRPVELEKLIGRRAVGHFFEDEPITWDKVK